MRDALAALRPSILRHPLPERGGPKGLNALGTLAHHPELTRAFNTFNGHILFATTLTTRQRELIVLRVATLRNAPYEWAQHVVQGRNAGLSDDEIAAVREGHDPARWTPLENALLTAADELVATANVTDATWSALAAELDEQQLMDVVFTVGAYEIVAMAFNSFGVELDEDLR
jgi:alkylhydroperoxidase family enzyme